MEFRRVLFRSARTAVFGRAIEDVSALEQFLCEACEALTVHYTRRAILSLLTTKYEASQMLDASGRQAESLTSEVVGESRSFMELFKLLLASDRKRVGWGKSVSVRVGLGG